MSSAINKTAVIFGVAIFYIITLLFLGLIPNSDGSYNEQSGGGDGFSFTNITLNIIELGWLNTILLVPLILLVIFLFATSTVLYQME